MATSNTKMDAYANRAIEYISMSAADTLTFKQIVMGVGVFQGVGIVLHRVEFQPGLATMREFAAATDSLDVGIVTSDSLTSIVGSAPSIIYAHRVVGMGAVSIPWHLPIIADFTDLPGGGVILPANPIFIAMNSAGFAAAGNMYSRLWFSFKELSDKDYLELIQSQIAANI